MMRYVTHPNIPDLYRRVYAFFECQQSLTLPSPGDMWLAGACTQTHRDVDFKTYLSARLLSRDLPHLRFSDQAQYCSPLSKMPVRHAAVVSVL